MLPDPDPDWEDEDEDQWYGDPTRGAPRVVPLSDLPRVGVTHRSADTSFPLSNHSCMFVIVDSNGVHDIRVVFCSCPNGGREDLQLLDMGYYPAMITAPKTAFTFRVLDNFLLANKECNVPPRAYYSLLRRFTNNAFPHMVPVQLLQFILVVKPLM